MVFKFCKYVYILSELNFSEIHMEIYNDLMIGIGFKINPWGWGIDVINEVGLVKSCYLLNLLDGYMRVCYTLVCI